MSDTEHKLAVTPGDPAGIGLDILVKVAQYSQQHELVAFCNPELLAKRADLLGLPLRLMEHDPSRPAKRHSPGVVSVAGIPCDAVVEAGKPAFGAGSYVLSSIRQAVDACLDGSVSALVTGPVNKHQVNKEYASVAGEGEFFSGHTEYLAQLTGCDDVVMMLAVEKPSALSHPLRVALVTTHLSLRDVPDAITREKIEHTLTILHRDLRCKYGIEDPRIGVCGLNPHAGENGDLGHEELSIIDPCLDSLRSAGMNLSRALPADTLFTDKNLRDFDVVLAMYHDQGLSVLKSHGFGKSVNVTLGLPVIRTSVDHGTAYEIAGTGLAEEGSLQSAIDTAALLVQTATVP